MSYPLPRLVIPQTLLARLLWIRLVRRERLYYPRRTVDSLNYTILDDTPDSDVPLALLVPCHQKQRRAPLMEKPRRRAKAKGKAKGKAKADRCNSVEVDASREDAALGE